MTQISRSTRVATTVPGGVQKRRTLIISDQDPRNNPTYIANYIGEIKVLPYKEYVQYIKTTTFLDAQDPVEETTVSTLHPPTNIYWNPNEPSDQELVPSGLTHSINLFVTFDPATDDILTDGAITYKIDAVATGPAITQASISNGGSASQSNSGATILPSGTGKFTAVNASTISLNLKTTTSIQLKWKSVSSVTGYDILVSGVNQKDAVGKLSKVWHSLPATSASGYHYFTATAAPGHTFTGSYNFSIQAVYTGGTSKAVTYNGHVHF